MSYVVVVAANIVNDDAYDDAEDEAEVSFLCLKRSTRPDAKHRGGFP